ncbi:MAG TPA: LamG-like jellyroll fold domain-containing protein, partial [Flavobacteriaceae bacterium]
MKHIEIPSLTKIKLALLFFLINFIGHAQSDIQVEIVGGSVVYEYDIISITAGNAISFRITNTGQKSKCANLKIEDITLDPSTGFTLEHESLPKNIKPEACSNGDKYVDFTVTNVSGNCTTYTEVTILMNGNDGDFTFTFTLNGAPEINVLGGSPFADILNGSTTTSATNGTYFGVVDQGASVTRNYIITSTGSCPLDVTSITSSLSDFTVMSYVLLPDYSPTTLPETIDPGSYIIFSVTFLAPASTGTFTSTISVSNTDNTTFTFDVSAEIFDFNIPGPGGITADFRLWLKSTRGITKDGSSKVSQWKDIGTNGKDAVQPTSENQPTYLDDPDYNINFNPVIKFENDGGSLEQYLYNDDNGFYSQDMFIVMVPDATMTTASSRNTIFAGLSSGSAGDMTGIGFGNYSNEFTNEVLSYNQDVPLGDNYNGEAELNSTYSKAGIINVRNNAFMLPTGEDILYNSNQLTTSSVNDIPFLNVGYKEILPPFTVFGTKYWIGRNYDTQGSLNGRVAEIFTFAERVPEAGRQKIESYLAIKYGITLGTSTEAEKDYVNSFDTTIWDISTNSGYNYHVAGIGRDSISDLNQKQSKTLNMANEVTIGLNGIFPTNNANTNEFKKDGDFLVWGSNNAAYSGTSANTVTIASGITTSLTRIDRKWKIVESTEDVGGDVEDVDVSIPSDAFGSFSLGSDEEYVLIVSDNDNFANTDIIDVIPLKSDGSGNLQTWYDFDGTKYFTFGKASKLAEEHSINFASGDYLVGESSLNLNINAFTVSAWVKSASSANTRTIMAKGSKLQLRLNSADQVEVMVDDEVTPRFTSMMQLNDGKWHQVTFVYNSGTIFLYVDGVLDKSELNVVAPSPNYNRFSVGALYIDKNTIINPFLGEIDEVYIWDQGLTEDQIRYLMNQEIEPFDISGTNYVNGKILPQAATSNEVAIITWSKLKAYYDFNSYYGSTVEGLSDDGNFLRLKYLDKDKSLLDSQTIAVPYISAANGDWDEESTWVNGSDNMLPNALSLDGETYIDWNIVETSHDITSGDRDITVLGLKNNSGKITIADPNDSQDETNSGQGLTITHYLELDGVIDLVGESQLVQTKGSVLDADSGGYIERDQQGTANSFNYNYWSSSVGPIGGNSSTRGTGIASTNPSHTISGVLFDGTVSSSYQPINFSSSTTAADSSTPSNPRTISTRWLYKYYGPTNDYNSWIKINEVSSLAAGEGFTMKGTSGPANILSSFQNYVFKGLPNNGDISLALNKSSGDVDRLIGNPYPCVLDATEFILDNLSIDDGGTNTNGTVFNGALYFWDHFGEKNSHVSRDYVGGYAVRNLTGGVAAIANDTRINATLETGTKVPGYYIPVNQGFFVSTALDGQYNDNGDPITVVDGGTIVFKNSQRAFVTEAVDTLSTFMRTSKAMTSSSKTKKSNPIIRLKFDSPKGYHRQIAIGLNKKASNGFDIGYDAFIADINEEDMYWTFAGNKFVIQGVKTFDKNQRFPLELIVKEAGGIKIGLDGFENIDPNLGLYIKDNVTGQTYQINEKPFKTYLDAGVYSDRFSLVFQPSQRRLLSVEDSNLANSFSVYYNSKASELNVL